MGLSPQIMILGLFFPFLTQGQPPLQLKERKKKRSFSLSKLITNENNKVTETLSVIINDISLISVKYVLESNSLN